MQVASATEEIDEKSKRVIKKVIICMCKISKNSLDDPKTRADGENNQFFWLGLRNDTKIDCWKSKELYISLFFIKNAQCDYHLELEYKKNRAKKIVIAISEPHCQHTHAHTWLTLQEEIY